MQKGIDTGMTGRIDGRTTLWLTALLLGSVAVAAGCSSDNGLKLATNQSTDSTTVGSSAPALVEGLNPDQLALEQANAEAALLSTSDLPAGWAAADTVDDPSVPEARTKLARCVGVGTDRMFDFARTVAYGPNFESADGATIDHTIAVTTDENAQLYMANLAAPGVADCLAGEFQVYVQNAIDALNDDSTIDRPTVESVTAETVTVAPTGDETIGYRFTVKVDLDGTRAALYFDVRVTRVGNSLSSIFARSDASSPLDGAELDRLSALAASRLPIQSG